MLVDAVRLSIDHTGGEDVWPAKAAGSVTRRGFIRAIAGTGAALVLPEPASAAVNTPEPEAWFLHCETGSYWRVDDPVAWSLRNARHPLLARASERLLAHAPPDRERIIRLVVRRCELNLIELSGDGVRVHYWGRQGRGDLRPFLKDRRLARGDVWIELRDRKRERIERVRGDRFLFGDTRDDAPFHWPLDLYLSKWRRRNRTEADDWTAAPVSASGFAWEGLDDDRIPWAVLKSVWRKGDGPNCPNCDVPAIWTAFGYVRSGFLSRSARFTPACGGCRRWFDDHPAAEVEAWMIANIDPPLLPQYVIELSGTRTAWKPAHA